MLELSAAEVATLVRDIVGLQERRLVRVFEVPEPVGLWTTVLVYFPRTRFNAELPSRVADVVARGHTGLVEIGDRLAVLGTRLMDLYTGPLSPRELSAWVIDELARIDRACDLTDVVDNTTGAVIGFGIGLVLMLVVRPWRRGPQRRQRRSGSMRA